MQHPHNPARLLGRQLGGRQRLEHDRLGVRLCDGALQRMAQLAWKFEQLGLVDNAYHKRIFIQGYEQGYQRAGFAKAPPLPADVPSAASHHR
jgi:hypothetical protein